MIHKADESNVELKESAHDLVVNVEGELLVKGIGTDPGNLLPHNLCLIVDTLNREESLLEALSDGAVKHELLH